MAFKIHLPSDLIENLPACPSALREWVYLGFILVSTQQPSPEAIESLAFLALSGETPAIQSAALDALKQLSGQSADARETLCLLVMDQAHPGARELTRQQGILPADPDTRAAFFLLIHDYENLKSLDPHFSLLTRSFEASSPSRQTALLKAATTIDLTEWAAVAEIIANPQVEAFSSFAEKVIAFKYQFTRSLAVETLKKMALSGLPQAGYALCRIFMITGLEEARSAALETHSLPADLTEKALFFLLTGQWEQYETLDFDHRLLAIAYETAGKPLRLRIMAQVRQSGHMEWAQTLAGSRQIRWARDLTDTEWESILRLLVEHQDWPRLWDLAQSAPPLWSAALLQKMIQAGWFPEADRREEGFDALLEKAAACPIETPSLLPLSTLSGHLAEIISLLPSPDGESLYSLSSDQTARLWNLKSHQQDDFIHLTSNQVRSAAISPDGSSLVAGLGNNQIEIYHLQNHSRIKVLDGHQGLVKGLAITPDSRLLASGSFDKTLRLWNFPSGPCSAVLTGHTAEIFCLAIAPDGQTLISGCADHTLRLWSLPEGQLITRLLDHHNSITALAISPDGHTFLSADRDRILHSWTLPDGFHRHASAPLAAQMTSLAIHPELHLAFGAGLDGNIHICSTSPLKSIHVCPAHTKPITSILFFPNQHILATGSLDRTIGLWDIRPLIFTRTPAEQLTQAGDALVSILKNPSLNSAGRRWMAFTASLALWRKRYDIQIGLPQHIQIGEFDIEL
ncbi:MAG TPA: WD40 repeat domain-containing protein [Anaerolineaceae bacterium]|nr:WD40 repeat domain-containing protein [Anaerolineaceae bacterium]HPN50896.1 WD40 repeat domain-containing protein [Anaerolineaceae bacterium]